MSYLWNLASGLVTRDPITVARGGLGFIYNNPYLTAYLAPETTRAVVGAVGGAVGGAVKGVVKRAYNKGMGVKELSRLDVIARGENNEPIYSEAQLKALQELDKRARKIMDDVLKNLTSPQRLNIDQQDLLGVATQLLHKENLDRIHTMYNDKTKDNKVYTKVLELARSGDLKFTPPKGPFSGSSHRLGGQRSIVSNVRKHWQEIGEQNLQKRRRFIQQKYNGTVVFPGEGKSCDTGYKKINGFCYPKCGENNPCHEDLYCVDGYCSPNPPPSPLPPPRRKSGRWAPARREPGESQNEENILENIQGAMKRAMEIRQAKDYKDLVDDQKSEIRNILFNIGFGIADDKVIDNVHKYFVKNKKVISKQAVKDIMAEVQHRLAPKRRIPQQQLASKRRKSSRDVVFTGFAKPPEPNPEDVIYVSDDE